MSRVPLPDPQAAGELRQLMSTLRWSAYELARRLDIGDKTVREWIGGRRAPPDNVLPWLREIAGTMGGQMDDTPLPVGWQDNP